MALDPLIQAEADAEIADVFAQLEPLQETRLAENPFYWQGLFTADEPPSSAYVPNPTVVAEGETQNWTEFGVTFPASMVSAIACLPYAGPFGNGWSVIATLKDASGTVWQKAVQVGPEPDFGYDWSAM